MTDKVKKIFLVSRPISWINTAYPFAAGYLVTGGSVNAIFILATIYFLGPYNLLMYGINDVFDYQSDIRNPRKGGIEGMREQRSLHPTIIRWAIYFNLPFLIALVALGSWLSGLVLSGVVFLVTAYSIPRLRFKEQPILDSITSSLHFVGPLLFALSLTGAWSAALVYITAFFLWGVASHALGAVQDILPDRQGGIRSIATSLGARATIWLSLTCYTTSVILIALQGSTTRAVAVFMVLYIVNCLPYLSITDDQSALVNSAWRRFIWLNFLTGAVITVTLILTLSSTS